MGNVCARDFWEPSSEGAVDSSTPIEGGVHTGGPTGGEGAMKTLNPSAFSGGGGGGGGSNDDNSTIALQMDDEEDLESEDNDDDVVEDLPEPSSKLMQQLKRPRNSVSAEAYGEWNRKQDFKPPVIIKTEEQKKNIREVISDSFLFSSLDEGELDTIIDAFEEQNVKKDVYIIHQGDDGDKLYLIQSGEVDVYKKLPGKETEDFMCKMIKGDTFGELALMYNAPRAATVKAATDMRLWALDRRTFNTIVRDSAAKKRDMYDSYLKEVSLLKSMNDYERSKISDALKKEMFTDSAVIIKEGDQGNTFYILIEGEAEAIKEGKTVMNYKKGDYFGELALLKDQPRAATVKAKGTCQVVSLDRKSFKRLLGPLETILNRNLENYRNVCRELGLDTKYLEK